MITLYYKEQGTGKLEHTFTTPSMANAVIKSLESKGHVIVGGVLS